MADAFDDILKSEESIFINDSALDYNFIPPVLLCRTNQQSYIGNSIRLLEQGKMEEIYLFMVLRALEKHLQQNLF